MLGVCCFDRQALSGSTSQLVQHQPANSLVPLVIYDLPCGHVRALLVWSEVDRAVKISEGLL